MDKRTIIYYDNELSDEFSRKVLKEKTVDAGYVYYPASRFKRFTHFFWYRLIAIPIAWTYTKLKFRHKIVGGEKFKEIKKSGYFLYGNHTQELADAFFPGLVNISKDAYVLANPNDLNIPVIGKIFASLGGLPLPGGKAAYKNFLSAIERRYLEGNAIAIYPEAHIWPYYTKIRPFADSSFHYPAQLNAPVFCFTNTYQKRKFGKRPKIVTYIDGPFFADPLLSPKERQRTLRDTVYEKMCEKAKKSTVEKIKYVRRQG